MGAPVLLADDSPHARRMGSEYLAGLGYEVIAVADGAAALAAIARQPPRLILADAALPGFDGPLGGMDLCRAVRAHPEWGPIPVLLLLGALARVEAGALDGADGVLRKPLSSAGLEQWLRRQPGLDAPPASPSDAVAPPPSPAEMLALALRAAALGEE
ncbi:MAG: response regulator [Terriglobales bacterium]